MAMDKKDQRGKEKNMLVGVAWNFASELKVILTAFFILCTIATLIQFIPSRYSPFSPSDFRLCLTSLSPSPPSNITFSSSSSSSSSLLSMPVTPVTQTEETVNNTILKRAFNPYGTAAYNFIQMGAYRSGTNSFAIVGLGSKPLHSFGKPKFQCEWIPNSNQTASAFTKGYRILPDWGYGRVYTVVVVHCTFIEHVGGDGSGGKLILYAATSGGGDANLKLTDRIEALSEAPSSLNFSLRTSSPPKYDYFYCGSPLYGNLSPQRLREWMAYHVRLLGAKSHFVIHDAGGVHEGVLEVLKPWMELGYVTLQDIREQERFDGYYHNQFLVLNDCLHRYKFMTKWMFFFDVDEYIYVTPGNNLRSVMDSLSEFSQITIEQMPMSNKLCLTEDAGKTYRKWGFEKLVYRDVKKVVRRDRKYAIQPQKVYATGVHMSQNIAGKTNHKTYKWMKYYHYHGTTAQRREPCRVLFNVSKVTFEETPYVLDKTMRGIAGAVKRFELKTIGSKLQRIKQ